MAEAHLLRLEGRFDEALEAYRQTDAVLGDLGLDVIRLVLRNWPAEIDAYRGRYEEAIAAFRDVVAQLEEIGETSYRSTILIQLARLLYERGEAAEAEELAVAGEILGAEDDVVNYALGRAIRASIAADQGRLDDGERLATESLDFALRTDFPFTHAASYKAIAHVASKAGRTEEARAALERALASYESVGATVDAGRARTLLIEL